MGLISESSPAACLTLTRVQLWWDSRRSCYACALIPLSVTTPPTRCSFLLTLLNLEVKLHAFVQSHSQSQATLMFVNCSQNGQLGLHQNQCTFQKIHSLSTRGAHSRLLAHIASPTSPPSLCRYTTHSSVLHTATVEMPCLRHCSTNGKLRIALWRHGMC